MLSSINKTMIASLVALTVGFAIVGPIAPAFASDSTATSSPGGNNTYNPLAPSSNGYVGSIETRMPIVGVDQVQTNCHLYTHGMADCSSSWTPGQNID